MVVACALAVAACGGDDAGPRIDTTGCWPDTVVAATGDLADDIEGVWVGIQNAAPVYWQFHGDGTVAVNRYSDVDDDVSRSVRPYQVSDVSIEFLDDAGGVLVTYEMSIDSRGSWRQPSWDMRKCEESVSR